MDNSQTNIDIEVVNRQLLFSRVNLLQTIDEFEELNVQLVNLQINEVPSISYPKLITVPKHPLLSPKQVKFPFRVVQYHSFHGQESQLLRLEPVALFAEFYNVPVFLQYIKNTFFRGTVNTASRSVLWLNRNSQLFDTRFINVCLNNMTEFYGTTRERLEKWSENKKPRLTNVNLRKHLKAARQAFWAPIRTNNVSRKVKANCTCGKWNKGASNTYYNIRTNIPYPVDNRPRNRVGVNR
jgi:hypothetical protein